MDRPRHPQVIRTWKTEQARKNKWLAPLKIVKIEGGKTTDGPRRTLMKSIGDGPNFTIVEEKSTERDAFYSWLSKTGSTLNLDSSAWLVEAARHWLWRRLPKENWAGILDHVRIVRRTRRLEDGFEEEGPRLFSGSDRKSVV